MSLISAHPAVRSEGQQIPEQACLRHTAFGTCALISVWRIMDISLAALVIYDAIVNFLVQREVLSNRISELF